jgi:uncharacterized integral membrane protein (TIGR00698 family)
MVLPSVGIIRFRPAGGSMFTFTPSAHGGRPATDDEGDKQGLSAIGKCVSTWHLGAPMLEDVMIRNIFYVGIIVSASGLIGPPFALAAGLAFGLMTVHDFHGESRDLSRFLLQGAVVCMGFGMNLKEVVHAGASGFVYTAISITFALGLGVLLGKLLEVGKTQSLLISFGTAICGGSAIAAMGPVLNANEEEMAVSLGTVFVLNSVALLVFPLIGHLMHLSQTQFGLWAALAIHDTSSVVGAGAKYGATALAVGTTVKLTRALWIVPLAIATSILRKSKAKVQWPWFILYFCVAAVAASYVPRYAPGSVGLFTALNRLGRSALTVVLFLIGTGVTRDTVKEVGVRPLVQGVTLWVVVASLSLWGIHVGWIAL